MSAGDILEQLRAANPAPQADRIDVDDAALLSAIDRRYASLSASTERAVTRRLDVLDRAEGSPFVDPEIDASGATDEPPGVVRHRSLIVFAAAAAAVIVAVVAFSSLRDESAQVTTVDQPPTSTLGSVTVCS